MVLPHYILYICISFDGHTIVAILLTRVRGRVIMRLKVAVWQWFIPRCVPLVMLMGVWHCRRGHVIYHRVMLSRARVKGVTFPFESCHVPV